MATRADRNDKFTLSGDGSGEPSVAAGSDANAGVVGNDGGSPTEFVKPPEPGTGASVGDSATEPKRGRGRPKGSTNKPATGKTPGHQDIGAIEGAILSIHLILAQKIPEMALEPSEAKMLAEAVSRVSRHYPAVSAVITGKIADHVSLFTALTAVYGTRLLAIKNRMDNPPRETPSVVTPFPSQNFRPN